MKYQADLIKKLGHAFVVAIEHKAFSDSLSYPGHCSLFSTQTTKRKDESCTGSLSNYLQSPQRWMNYYFVVLDSIPDRQKLHFQLWPQKAQDFLFFFLFSFFALDHKSLVLQRENTA